MKELEKLHGKRFTAKIQNTSVKGKICVDECYGVNCVYLCQNARNGDSPPNKHLFGYKYGWVILDFSCPEDNSVTELKIIETMTKEEIENYKDFKEGDLLCKEGCDFFKKVEAVLNNIVFTIDQNKDQIAQFYSKTEIYDQGWRLHVEPEASPIVEMTLEEMAKRKGIDIDLLRKLLS